MQVRVCIFLLSGLFCCLGFSVVFVLLFGRGRVLFLLFGRGRGPRPNSNKKKNAPAQTAKKKTPLHPPSMFFFCCLGGWACLCFCGLGAGVFLFLLFGRGSCFFLLFGRGRVYVFAVWAVRGGYGGGVGFFCCLGGWRDFVFAVWAGDGSSLTYRSAWLVFKRPNNKKDQTAKKNTGSQPCSQVSNRGLQASRCLNYDLPLVSRE